MVKLEFSWVAIAKDAGLIADAKRVDVCLVVTTRLVGTNEQLDLQVVGNVRSVTDSHGGAGGETGSTALGGGNNGRRRLESLRGGHAARLHVLEVDTPRDVHRAGVLLPLGVHLVDVVGRVALEERIAGILQGRELSVMRSTGGGLLVWCSAAVGNTYHTLVGVLGSSCIAAAGDILAHESELSAPR